ncbi:MAG: hypothetical protein Ct9H300mP1_13100 [Planctomycetaceae bacterium]|nr:MAG: hypothetical protein Ct9H300mP1_13100 [Planctomycetaceae bacterium]
MPDVTPEKKIPVQRSFFISFVPSHSIPRHHIENEFHFRDKPEHTFVLITARLDGPTKATASTPAPTFNPPDPYVASSGHSSGCLPGKRTIFVCLQGHRRRNSKIRNSPLASFSHPPACFEPLVNG